MKSEEVTEPRLVPLLTKVNGGGVLKAVQSLTRTSLGPLFVHNAMTAFPTADRFSRLDLIFRAAIFDDRTALYESVNDETWWWYTHLRIGTPFPVSEGAYTATFPQE